MSWINGKLLWNNNIRNKLLEIKPTIGEHQSVVPNIRKEEIVSARLCIGNTRSTHLYLCIDCDAPFTVRQLLLECIDFTQEIIPSMFIT